MNENELIQGRRLGAEELALVQSLLTTQPGWSRWRISRELAQRWDWRTATGQLKEMAARTLRPKLAQRGWIALPPRRWASPNRLRHEQMPALAAPVDREPMSGPLADWQPLTVTEVSPPRHPDRALFEGLLHRHHYLSYRNPVGENLQYLGRAGGGRPVACLLFGSAAGQCAARDGYIGWTGATRAGRLELLTNNPRFLISPWGRIPHLASQVPGRVTRRLGADWQRKAGHPIYLLETFVERARFAGICYQAANGVRVGQTKGRTRQDGADGRHQPVASKEVSLYPRHPRFAERLRDNPPPPHPVNPPAPGPRLFPKRGGARAAPTLKSARRAKRNRNSSKARPARS